MQGIELPTRECICLEVFINDPNALVANDNDSIACFWECVNTIKSQDQFYHSQKSWSQMYDKRPRTMTSR